MKILIFTFLSDAPLFTGVALRAHEAANSGVRGEFLLGIFPPDHGGNHAPTPPAPQTPVKP
jgi:hypothetical protein